ncbi:hypothetical protein [Schlesneria paludicola]|uniref:hypothetical protein n=1 Tax=Schlesneria paludicola TaxID=360056 RepID=UPI00029A0D5D|nr:hypothetical protein [Schlesneria paludicola]
MYFLSCFPFPSVPSESDPIQPTLRETIEAYFAKHLETDLEDLQYRSYKTYEEGHGRIDERTYYLTRIPADFPLKKEWPWVKAIGYSLRVSQQGDGPQSCEVRYYIVSRYLSRKRFGEEVRGALGHRIDALNVGCDIP